MDRCKRITVNPCHKPRKPICYLQAAISSSPSLSSSESSSHHPHRRNPQIILIAIIIIIIIIIIISISVKATTLAIISTLTYLKKNVCCFQTKKKDPTAFSKSWIRKEMLQFWYKLYRIKDPKSWSRIKRQESWQEQYWGAGSNITRIPRFLRVRVTDHGQGSWGITWNKVSSNFYRTRVRSLGMLVTNSLPNWLTAV